MVRYMHAFIITLGLLVGAVAPLAITSQVDAATVDVFKACQGVESEICNNRADERLFGAGSIWERVINMLIFLIGAVAVVMIIVGGMKYATSGGDSSAINSAKNTILYAVVGLVIAVMAYAIVNFVVNRTAA